jgi:hypothetical protein
LFVDFTEDLMELQTFLKKHKSQIVEEAVETLQRAELKSYRRSPIDQNKLRIEKLLDLTISGVSKRSLFELTEYSEMIARERFNAGYDLHEVHAAFNVLEEAIWKKVMDEIEPAELGKALGLISTVLGAGKESLALTYVALAGKSKTATLDLSELFGR